MDKSPIQDFGTKIGGARKDLAGSITRTDVDGMTPEERLQLVRKDKVWPTPDYKKLIQSHGFNQEGAAAVRMLRGCIPPAPSTGRAATEVEKQEGAVAYVELVNAIRSFAMQGKTLDDLAAAARGPNIDHDLIGTVSEGHRTMLQTGPRMEETTQKAFRTGAHTARSKIRSALLYACRGELDRTTSRMIRTNTAWPEGQSRMDVWLRKNKISVKGSDDRWMVAYSNLTSTGGTPEGRNYVIEKLNGLGFQEVLGQTYPSKEAASDKMREFAELRCKAEEVERKKERERIEEWAFGKKRPPSDFLIERTGRDHRTGREADGQDYQDEFAFRGGEFGNWVNQSERQEVLNRGYDALKDMAEVMNVPPTVMSAGGKLAIAFGARGHGKASAHYEPGRRVINLTKPRGEGCLAHEFAHGLDHMLGLEAEKLGMVKQVLFPTHAGYLSNVSLNPRRPEEPESEQEKLIRDLHKSIGDLRQRTGPMCKEEALESRADQLSETLTSANMHLPGLIARVKELPPEQRDRVLLEIPSLVKEPGKEFNAIALCSEVVRACAKTPELAGNRSVSHLMRLETRMLKEDQALKEIREAPEDATFPASTRKTKFMRMSAEFDAKRSNEYYSERWEMFARAFESSIALSLAEKNQVNYFLVGEANGAIYPQGYERTEFAQTMLPLMARIPEVFPNFAPDPKVPLVRATQPELNEELEPDDGMPVAASVPAKIFDRISPENTPERQTHNQGVQLDLF